MGGNGGGGCLGRTVRRSLHMLHPALRSWAPRVGPPPPGFGSWAFPGQLRAHCSPAVGSTRETGACCPLQQQRQGGCMWIVHNQPESNHRTARGSLWPEPRAPRGGGRGQAGAQAGSGHARNADIIVWGVELGRCFKAGGQRRERTGSDLCFKKVSPAEVGSAP